MQNGLDHWCYMLLVSRYTGLVLHYGDRTIPVDKVIEKNEEN